MYLEYLEFAKDIASYAKQVILKYYDITDKSSYKEDHTIVTLADKDINNYLIKRVKEKYPNHSVDGEEEQFGSSNYVWVCDPIDGTAMYARHIKTAVFSLALVVDGESVLGVVYDPFDDDLYYALKDSGAYKNDKKIQVNNFPFGEKSICHYDMWPLSEYDLYDVIKELNNKTYIVSIGSVIRACMCVATGEFNCVIFPGTKHKNCDLAASSIIVKEAGGIVTDLFGNNQRYDCDINGAIVSNKIVYPEILELTNKYLHNKKR